MRCRQQESSGMKGFTHSLAVLFLLAIGPMACDTNPSDPDLKLTAEPSFPLDESAFSEAIPLRPQPWERLPSRIVDLPPTARAYDHDDAVLVAAVREQRGTVIMGLKTPDAPHTLTTGRSPAMSRSEVLQVHSALEALGVEIDRTYASIPVVAATIPPESAPALRRLPFVDFVEPAIPLLPFSAQASQDTSWGARQVRAHPAWGA
jgi:hypothetical protein